MVLVAQFRAEVSVKTPVKRLLSGVKLIILNVLFTAFFENISSGLSKIFQVERADSCPW
jgi:chromate transport protein ChrA